MKCIYCGLGTTVCFACPQCQDVKFYVCNKECQKIFWKQHKEQHHGFPPFFNEIPSHIEAEGRMDDWETLVNAYRNVKVMREMMPHRIMIDFEKADLKNDVMWLEQHWKAYRNGMVFHALMSFGTFEWVNFRQWLQYISANDDMAKKTLDLFQEHPESKN